MENNDYIRQRDGDGTKAAQRRNVRRPMAVPKRPGAQRVAPKWRHPNVKYRAIALN